ncbi:MAG: YncE family protein [Candidatus Korobacteraceae bacterium]|jgi:YVTN family beta-propeller protein
MDFLRRTVVATIACSWLFLSGCGNTYRPVASILPETPGNPQLADSVAVFNVNPNAASTGSLSVFNVAGDSNVGNYAIGANDQLATVTPPQVPLTSRLITFAGSNSFVATADTESNTVTLVNTLLGSTSIISLPAGFVPGFITATATTGQILVSLQATPGSTACPGGKGAIGIILTSTAALTNTICAGSKPGFLLVAQKDAEVFILDQTDDSVSVLNLVALTPSSTTSTPIAVGTTPIWATASQDGSTVYVLNQGSNSISVIDAVAETVTGTITPAGLNSPSVIITDPNFNRLYISNTGGNSVTALDASTPALTPVTATPLTVGAAPVALAVTPDGTSVYVANTGANTVSVIHANSLIVSTLTPTSDTTARVQSVAVSQNTENAIKAFIAVTTTNDKANGIYVVLTSNDSFVSNDTGSILNVAPPQDPSCDVTESCSGVPLQRPVQIVPRI